MENQFESAHSGGGREGPFFPAHQSGRRLDGGCDTRDKKGLSKMRFSTSLQLNSQESSRKKQKDRKCTGYTGI